MEKACGKTGGNGEGEQESCGNGDKRPAGIAASQEEREDLVREVEDEGNEDGPQYETQSQAGHPVPYRLHTAILDRPPSSAATMEVQGLDTQ